MEFLSLVIVVVAAFMTPIIVHRFNINFLPVVVAEILMGIVIGHSFLNLVEEMHSIFYLRLGLSF